MSWYDDDPDVDSLFGELAQSEGGLSEPIEDVELLEVGDVVGGLYRVETVGNDGRARVKLIGMDHDFELRQMPEIYLRDDSSRSRAWEELDFIVGTAGFLTSENLGFITDYGYCVGCGGYVVCEWVEGQSLADFMAEGQRFELEDASKFMVEIGGALAVMHEVGLSHGLRDAQDLVRDTDGRWRLLAPGLRPSKAFDVAFPVPIASELRNFRSNTQAGDIYALAAAVYGLLAGEFPDGDVPFGPSELRADLPEALDDSVLRALSTQPEDRFPDIEQFQSEFIESVRVGHVPTVSGFDAREASRVLNPPKEVGGWVREPSVIVRVEELYASAPALRMEFASVARLRREYRRNILAGGLFVPTANRLQRSQSVGIELVFGPTGEAVTVNAKVAQVAEASKDQPAGVGLIFDAEAKDKILGFLRLCDPVLELSPQEKIEALVKLDKNSQVDAGEAFLLSRLNTPMELGALRASFQGLPFDFEEALGGLLQKNYVRVISSSAPMAGAIVEPGARRPTPQPRVEAKQVAQPIPQASPPAVAKAAPLTGVELALEKAEYQEARGNFRAAIEILESARNATPHVKVYLKLVRLYATFQKNWGKAGDLLREVSRIAPDNEDVKELQRWLVARMEDEQARKLYSVTVEGAQVRVLLIHPDSRKLWFELHVGGGRPRREIHEVDYVRSKGAMVSRANDPARMSAIPANPTDFAAIPQTNVGRRSLQLDRAQTRMNEGPWYRIGPAPVCATVNSKFLVFDRNPKILEDGLFIVNEGKDIAPLRLNSDGTRGKSPVLCPDESGGVAWIRTSPSFGVCIAEPFQAARMVLELPGDATLAWIDSKTLLSVSHPDGVVHTIARRGDSLKLMCKLNTTISKFWVDAESSTGAALDTQNNVVWIDLKSGEVRGKSTLGSTPDAGLLRSDGFLALRYPGGTKVIRIGKSFSKNLPLVAEPSGFSPTSVWRTGHPLLLLCPRPDGADVYSVDPKKIGT